MFNVPETKELTCRTCLKGYDPRTADRPGRYCSIGCEWYWRTIRSETRGTETSFCEVCGTPFWAFFMNQSVCSPMCSEKVKRDKSIKVQRIRRQAYKNGEFLDKDKVRMVSYFNNSCAACGGKSHICIDHWIPISKGGKHNPNNIIPLCIKCNSSKGGKSPDIWMGLKFGHSLALTIKTRINMYFESLSI